MATAEQKLHISEFTNEPFIDFSKPENRKRRVVGHFGFFVFVTQ